MQGRAAGAAGAAAVAAAEAAVVGSGPFCKAALGHQRFVRQRQSPFPWTSSCASCGPHIEGHVMYRTLATLPYPSLDRE